MKLITYLSDQTFNKDLPEPDRTGYKVRRAGRAVLTNEKGEVALMWVAKSSIYKIPGGGIEDNEDIHEGVKREVMEEAGFDCFLGEQIGITIEFRDEWKMAQISYCFKASTTGEALINNLTEDEKAAGFELKWFPISEAIKQMESHASPDYDAQFMGKRDFEILKASL